MFVTRSFLWHNPIPLNNANWRRTQTSKLCRYEMNFSMHNFVLQSTVIGRKPSNLWFLCCCSRLMTLSRQGGVSCLHVASPEQLKMRCATTVSQAMSHSTNSQCMLCRSVPSRYCLAVCKQCASCRRHSMQPARVAPTEQGLEQGL